MSVTIGAQAIADLQRELRQRRAQSPSYWTRQTATAKVFQVVKPAPGDLATIVDAMLEKSPASAGPPSGGFWTH